MDASGKLPTRCRVVAGASPVAGPAFVAPGTAQRSFHARAPDLRPAPCFQQRAIALACITVSVVICVIPISSPLAAADKFQRLSGPQLLARLPGMEMTDEVHWADVYLRGGILKGYSMGRKTSGKWSIRTNELCVERGREEATCYQVWSSGSKIELRRAGSDLPLQGILQKPTKRD